MSFSYKISPYPISSRGKKGGQVKNDGTLAANPLILDFEVEPHMGYWTVI